MATSEEGKRLEIAIAKQQEIDRARAAQVAADAQAERDRKALEKADKEEAQRAKQELQRRQQEGK